MEEVYRGFLIEIFNYDGIKSYRILKIINNEIVIITIYYRYGNNFKDEDIILMCKNYIDSLLNESNTELDYISKSKPIY